MGYRHLFEILTPVVRHPLPNDTIRALQQQLHRLLKTLIQDETFALRLRLPELSVVTELEHPVIWFPIFSSRARLWVSKGQASAASR